MLTLTLGHQDVMDGLADLASSSGAGGESDRMRRGVRLLRWHPQDRFPAAEDPADVDMVVVPNYAVGPAVFEALRQLPRLRVVQLPSAGYEHALPHLPPGITLCNGRGVHDAGTAELAVALTLASQRAIDDAVRAMPEGRWKPVLRSSLADRRVMVLGYGSIGAAVARRLDAFEVEVVAVASRARATPERRVHGVEELRDLIAGVDVVIVTLPLTDSTERLVDARVLAAMRDGALLVNVGRGRVVDTEALLAEVGTGRLRAALDVTDPEPLPADHPLWRSPGVIVTPHVGGLTDATTPRLVALVRRQVEALLAGEDLHNVVART